MFIKIAELCCKQNIAQRDWREHSKFLAKNYARSANNMIPQFSANNMILQR